MKRIFSVVIAGIMMFLLSISVHATDVEVVEPRDISIAAVDNRLSFIGTNGMAFSDIIGYTGTTSITATLTVHVLQGSRWVYVGSDTGSGINDLYLQVDFTGVSGSYYRSMLELTVVRNGVTETDTEFKTKWC